MARDHESQKKEEKFFDQPNESLSGGHFLSLFWTPAAVGSQPLSQEEERRKKEKRAAENKWLFLDGCNAPRYNKSIIIN